MPIQIDVKPALKQSEIRATASGSESWDVTSSSDSRLAWFGLTDKAVRAAWDAMWKAAGTSAPLGSWGSSADGVLVANFGNVPQISPTIVIVGDPGADLSVDAKPDSGLCQISIKSVPSIVTHQTFHNALSEAQEFETEVSEEHEDSVSSEWSKESTIGGSLTVEVKVGTDSAGASTSGTVTWEAKEGEAHTQEQKRNVGVTTKLHIELAPGEWCVACYAGYWGTLSARSPITAELNGHIVFNAPPGTTYNIGDSRKPVPLGHKTPVLHLDSFAVWIGDFIEYFGKHEGMSREAHTAMTVDRGWLADTIAEMLPTKGDTDDDILAAVTGALEDASGVKLEPGVLSVTTKGN